MRAFSYLAIAVLILLLMLGGCSSTYVGSGYRALDQDNAESAKQYFERALAQRPGDLKAHQGLGLAEYKLANYDAAAAQFQQVQEKNKRDGLSALYLGLIDEQRGDIASAKNRYQAYALYNEKTDIARQIEGRLLYLKNELLRQQAKKAVQFERSAAVDTVTGNAVGVLPFVMASGTPDSLQPLATGLAAAVMYDLSQIEGLRLVERLQLKYIMQELDLQQQGRLDPNNSLRLGAIAQANHLVNGNLALGSQNNIDLQSGIVALKDTSYYYSAAYDGEGTLNHIMDMQKQLSQAILDSLGITLNSSQKKKLAAGFTDSLSAFLDYSRGIEALDDGDYSSARSYFEHAAQIDPGFTQAVAMQQQSNMMMEGSGSVQQFESQVDVAAATGTGGPTGSGASANLGADIFDQTTPPSEQIIERNPRAGLGTASVSGSTE